MKWGHGLWRNVKDKISTRRTGLYGSKTQPLRKRNANNHSVVKTGQALVLVSGVFKRLLVARARLSRAVEAFGVRSPGGSRSQGGLGREVDDVLCSAVRVLYGLHGFQIYKSYFENLMDSVFGPNFMIVIQHKRNVEKSSLRGILTYYWQLYSYWKKPWVFLCCKIYYSNNKSILYNILINT